MSFCQGIKILRNLQLKNFPSEAPFSSSLYQQVLKTKTSCSRLLLKGAGDLVSPAGSKALNFTEKLVSNCTKKLDLWLIPTVRKGVCAGMDFTLGELVNKTFAVLHWLLQPPMEQHLFLQIELPDRHIRKETQDLTKGRMNNQKSF